MSTSTYTLEDLDLLRTDAEIESQSSDPVVQYAELEHARRSLEAQLKNVGDKLKALERSIVDTWIDRGQRTAGINGLTLFLKTEMYCSKRPEISGKELADVLIENGLGNAVGYNANSLKSWVKERLAAYKEEHGLGGTDDDLPEGVTIEQVIPAELAACITWASEIRLRCRAAK